MATPTSHALAELDSSNALKPHITVAAAQVTGLQVKVNGSTSTITNGVVDLDTIAGSGTAVTTDSDGNIVLGSTISATVGTDADGNITFS